MKITIKIEACCEFCERPIVINDVDDTVTIDFALSDYVANILIIGDNWLLEDEGLFCGDDCYEKYLARCRSERREDEEMNR